MPSPGHAERRQLVAGWATAAVLTLGVLTTWSLATARYGGPDEPGHVLRAAAVARGELLGRTVEGLVDGFRSAQVPAALATGDPRCYRHDQRVPATCARAMPGVTGQRRAASSAGTNPPWYYLAVGVPVRVLGDTSLVIWYRLAAAAWFAAVLAVALVRAPPGVRVSVVLALAPAAWFLGGVVNPNALEVALAAVAWVGVGRVAGHADVGTDARPAMAELAWIAVPTALMVVIRPIAAVAVVTTLVALAVLLHRLGRLGRAGWALVIGPTAMAVLASGLWNLWSDVVVRDPRAATNEGIRQRFGDALGGIGDTMRELSGSLGWAEFSVPWPLQLVWWSAVFCAGVTAWRRGGAHRAAWMMVATSVVAVPVMFETVLAGRLGFIWQGRYSASTAVGLVILAPGRWPARRWWLGAAVAGEVGTLWATLRRYTVGTNGSWLLRDQRWHPGVPPFVLLGVNAVLMTALVVWVLTWPDSVGGVSGRPQQPSCAPR